MSNIETIRQGIQLCYLWYIIWHYMTNCLCYSRFITRYCKFFHVTIISLLYYCFVHSSRCKSQCFDSSIMFPGINCLANFMKHTQLYQVLYHQMEMSGKIRWVAWYRMSGRHVRNDCFGLLCPRGNWSRDHSLLYWIWFVPDIICLHCSAY